MNPLIKLSFNAISKNEYDDVLQNPEHISNEILVEMSKIQRIKNVKKMKIWANSIITYIISNEFQILHLMDKFLSKKTNFLFQENKKFPKCTLKKEMTSAWRIFTNIIEQLFEIKTYIHNDAEFNTNDIVFVNDVPTGFPFDYWTKKIG